MALEKSCDDKDHMIISCRHEATDKVKHLQSTIQVSYVAVFLCNASSMCLPTASRNSTDNLQALYHYHCKRNIPP